MISISSLLQRFNLRMSFNINEFAQEASRQQGFLETQLVDLGKEPMLLLLEERARQFPLTEAETTMLNKLRTSNTRNKFDATSVDCRISAGAHQLQDLLSYDRNVQDRILLLFPHLIDPAEKELVSAAPRSSIQIEDNISQVPVLLFGFICLFLFYRLKTTIETDVDF